MTPVICYKTIDDDFSFYWIKLFYIRTKRKSNQSGVIFPYKQVSQKYPLYKFLQRGINRLGSKFQGGYRNALIGGVDRPDKTKIVGQLERGEAVGLDAELGKRSAHR